jgi:hypothetical protein
MYMGHLIQVVWAGLMSNCFTALNGTKQGGVISKILFHMLMVDLLSSLAVSGLGCYTRINFVAALAYTVEMFLVSHTPFAMHCFQFVRNMLCSLQYNILFNSNKSDFVVSKSQNMSKHMHAHNFCLDSKPVECVNLYV